MGRPKHNDPALFTGGEIAEATGLAQRNLQMLRDKRIGPFARQDQEGGLYTEDTVAEVAMISGCMGAGYSLTLAAALVTAFLDDNRNHPAARWSQLDSFTGRNWFEAVNWFHRHCIVTRNMGDALTESHSQDSLLLVADRQWVLRGTVGKPQLGMLVGEGVDPYGPLPLGRMDDLKRGHEPRFVPVYELIDVPPIRSEDDGKVRREKVDQADRDFQEAARRAVATVSVNMSLSIRRAFACVHAIRKSKGGPLWPEETV